ncbi:MAG: siderophore-interacting protein [Rubrivivax sp.]
MTRSPDAPATPPGPRKKGPPRRIDVSTIEPLSTRMVRIGFTGADLASFEWRGPAGHLKLIVPADGEHEASVPAPDGPRSPLMRTYTPRRFDAAAQRLDLDFVLHDHGPAGRWAMRAQVGDRLAMMGPAPGYRIDTDARWFLLIGDDTALPAIESILEELPATASAQVLIEVHGEDEARPLRSAAAVDVRWLARGGDVRSAGAALLDAVQGMGALPSGPGRIYVGCESAAMRRIRQHLIDQRQVERSLLVTRGYWQLGEANHPDQDYGDDGGA